MRFDVSCPYCDQGLNICHDDGEGYDEGETHEQECWKCNKIFTFTASITYSYEASAAPCLNGGEHEWQKLHHSDLATWPDSKHCVACGQKDYGTQNYPSIITEDV